MRKVRTTLKTKRERREDHGNDTVEVVGAENEVGVVVNGDAKELPVAEEGAPEGAESGVGPHDVAAVSGEGGGELGRDERLQDAPDGGKKLKPRMERRGPAAATAGSSA